MALRLAEIVVSGEIYNTRKNSVHGVLEFRGCDRPVSIQLTGNCDPDLAGRGFRFEVRERPSREIRSTNEQDLNQQRFAWMQIGSTGTMTADRKVRDFDCSIEEFLRLSKLGRQPPTEWKRCLYLEWYSQNGRVVLELVDPVIEFLDDNLDQAPQTASSSLDESGEVEQMEADSSESEEDWNESDLESDIGFSMDSPGFGLEDDDPYGLFSEDMEHEISQSSKSSDWKPEIDEETLQQWAQWDEIIDGTKDVPMSTLFDPPMKLTPESNLSDDEVKLALSVLLSRLALHCIALDMCEHSTPRDAYRYLTEDILKNEAIHPDLRPSGFVRHYSMSEECEACQKEFDDQYESEKRNRKDNDGESFDDPFSDEMPF